ncbi:LAGLIDADG family homing endonuclease [Clostridium chrysemydis]|uniref:LAGLIDADG family homing endonuclease n=1 Tax=Clostridium chrysemydis TaxID=2665504 RepID=UPI0018840C82|nr:LAGLIDADG family homing endonuclease [Clostridium chrysemydis]
MKDTDKAYIAGLIDGEGSIMLQRIHRSTYPSPVVSVTSTTIEILHYLKDIIGHGTITKKTNYNPEKHKDCYTYILTYDKAINLLKDIYPYLIIKIKKERAKLIIDEYKSVTLRNGRYSKEQLALKLDFYNRFMSIK